MFWFILTKSNSDADFIAEMEDFLVEPATYLADLPYSHGAHFFLYNPQFVFFGWVFTQRKKNLKGELVEKSTH